MRAFPLDEEQTMAILELQLYRIAQLEIHRIVEELEEKKKEAARIRSILASEAKLWGVVQKELEEVAEKFGDERRTRIGSSEEIAEFDPTAYIVRENTNVVLTKDGWIKRVGRLTNVESTRVREGDAVIDVAPGSTLDTVIFLSTEGIAYTMPIDQIPPSSGYGEPLSKHVKMGDGGSILKALSTDARFTPADYAVKKEESPGPYLLIATKLGAVMRFPLTGLRTPSTKAGRKYCRLREGDRVVWVELLRDEDSVFLCSKHARILHFAIKEVPVLSNAGRGVRGIRIATDDEVLGGALMSRPSDVLKVRNEGDKQLSFGQMKYQLTSRGGKGIKTSARTGFVEVIRPDIVLVDWSTLES
jgi:DNA gyrase subunit A